MWLLGFQVEDYPQDQRGADQILLDDDANCVGGVDLTCVKCYIRVSVAEHLNNLSPYSWPSMIEVSAEGVACYSISYPTLAVSTKAWHAVLYLITPWQYQQRLGMLFYILYHTLPSWQYPPRLGMLFYILYHALAVSTEGPTSKDQSYSRTAKAQAPKTKDMKAQAKQTETCRRAGVRYTLWAC